MYKIIWIFVICLFQQIYTQLTIKTIVSSNEILIYENNKTKPAFLPNFHNIGICKPTKRLILYNDSQEFNFSFSGVPKNMLVFPKISQNSNSELTSPTLTIFLNNENYTGNGNLKFNCKNTDKNPWSYIEIEISTLYETAKFEILKICNEDFLYSFDFSTILFIILIVFIVGIASRVELIEYFYFIPEPDDEIITNNDLDYTEYTWKYIVFYIIIASGNLIFCFIWPNLAKHVFTIWICFSGIVLFEDLFESYLPLDKTKGILQYLRYKIFYVKIRIQQLIASLISFSVVLSWYITQNWLINNLYAILFIFSYLRLCKINSFFLCTIFLAALLIYDVFWVFYSDKIFGKSLMINIVTEFDLPIKILMPDFNELPQSYCKIIGLGDLALPGLIISYFYRLNIARNTKLYYYFGIFSYFIAIMVCEIMLIIFKQGQPALLYISPILIICGISISVYRKEFLKVWNGTAVKENMQENKNLPSNIKHKKIVRINSHNRKFKKYY